MSTPQQSQRLRSYRGPILEYTETHLADVPEPKPKQGLANEIPNEADIVLDLDGWQKIIQDEEDLEFLRRSLEDVPAASVSSENLEESAWKEKLLHALYRSEYGVKYKSKTEGYHFSNSTGCARTEGVSKIPLSEKRKYLPQYAKAQISREEVKNQAVAAEAKLAQTRLGPGPVRTTARADRLAKRNSAREIDAKMANDDYDKARLNRLSYRTKHLRLGHSAIHGWGVFSETNVAADDMVIEFVGEVVSQKVAEKREKKYFKSGLGSSYLFSLDNGFVVDGTKRGNISRFINHSCTPNVASKIRNVDGSPRIFFFASRDIEAGKFFP